MWDLCGKSQLAKYGGDYHLRRLRGLNEFRGVSDLCTFSAVQKCRGRIHLCRKAQIANLCPCCQNMRRARARQLAQTRPHPADSERPRISVRFVHGRPARSTKRLSLSKLPFVRTGKLKGAGADVLVKDPFGPTGYFSIYRASASSSRFCMAACMARRRSGRVLDRSLDSVGSLVRSKRSTSPES